MFTEPRRRRRTIIVAALLALLIALPVALSRPEASSTPLSAVRLSADGTEAQNPPMVDVDLWSGMPQAAERYEQQKIEYIQAVIAEQERQRQAAAAAEAERKRQAAAAKAAAAEKAQQEAAKPAPKSAPAAPTAAASGGSVWDRLAQCESGGNWAINTGNGYYGGLQFNLQTWRAYGGTGYPHENSKAEQIRVAENLRAARGFQPWPSCSKKLGLR